MSYTALEIAKYIISTCSKKNRPISNLKLQKLLYFVQAAFLSMTEKHEPCFSDEIQASAGGVKLDTMFVDEGFGSLDEESLDQAMKALSSLSDGNRLVGIISHVADLKNRIDKQIVVTKEKSGGSTAQIIS